MNLLDPKLETGIIAVYSNKHSTDRFFCGKIIALGSDDIVLELVDSEAEKDGFCFFSASAIYRIETESQYLNNLNRKSSKTCLSQWHGDAWNAFLDFAEIHEVVVQVKNDLCKRVLFGVVLEHTNNRVIFRRIHKDGSTGKKYQIDRGEIAQMTMNSCDEHFVQIKMNERKDTRNDT